MVFKILNLKAHSIHLVNNKIIIISLKIISFQASTETNKVAITIRIKINFQIKINSLIKINFKPKIDFRINKILNFNQIITNNLVNLINKIMAIINLEILISINKMDLIVSNQIIILEIAAQLSIQALITQTIMVKILMEISTIHKIINFKAKLNLI